MKIGISIFATDTTLQPIELATAVEERGFESIWLPEHSHIPTSRKTPWGGRKNAPPLPDMYWHTHDTFVALAAMAAVTERIKLATGITLVAQHDPIWLAKQVASLDMISKGRAIFGVGFGWNVEEMEQHGVDPRTRRQLTAEKIEAMKALWTQEEASYEGEMVSLEPSWAWPKPVQQPHPPIVLGAGVGPRNMDALFRFGTGWIPFSPVVDDALARLDEECERRGRNRDEFEISVWATSGTARAFDELRDKGIDRVVLPVRSGTPAEVLTQLDELAELL